MSDDGFTPDQAPVNRAPASDDGFQPDPAPAAAAPVQAAAQAPVTHDDGFAPDPQPTQNDVYGTDGKSSGWRGYDLTKMQASPMDAVQETLGTAAKGIGAVLEPLQQPMRELAAPVAKAMGIPVERKELAAYPWKAPDVSWSTITDKLSDKIVPDDDIIKTMLGAGFTAQQAAMAVGAKKVGVFGIGALADFFGDPLTYVGMGLPNAETRAALESGQDVNKIERSTIALTSPIKGTPIAEYTNPTINKAASDTMNAARDAVFTPAGMMTGNPGSGYAAFDWKTGDHVLDVGSTLWSGEKAGASKVLDRQYGIPYSQINPTDEEVKVLANVAETTPNLRPNIPTIIHPEEVNAAAEAAGADGVVADAPSYKQLSNGKQVEVTPEEHKVLGLSEEDLRPVVQDRIMKTADEEGVPMTDQRATQLAELSVNAKKMNAEKVEIQYGAGKLNTDKDLSTQLLPDYSPHVKTPEAAKALRDVNQEQQALDASTAKQANQLLDTKISTANPFNKYREVQGSVREANAAMRNTGKTGEALKAAGVDNLFEENPYKASMQSLLKAHQSAMDQKFMELMQTRGFHFDEFNKLDQRSPRVWYDKKLYSTPEQRQWADLTSAKLNHMLIPSQSTGMKAAIESYNKVFRSTTLLKPNYWVQNFGDSLAKNAIQGVGPKSYLDAAKAYYGRGIINLNGKMVPATAVRDALEKLNVVNYAHTAEMVDAAVHLGKTATAQGLNLDKGVFSKLFEKANMVGAKGENWNRAAMYLDRLDRGYNPAQALYDVQNFHFDFSRTTPAMDSIRMLFPFAQFPMKTAGIAGELALRRPGIYNQQVYLKEQLDRAMNDPLESATLRNLIPDYAKIGGAIPIGDAGAFMNKSADFLNNMIGNNTWVARSLLFPELSRSGLPQYQVYAKLPVGTDALNQYALWEGDVLKNGGFMSGPAWSFMQGVLTGKDQFTGESYDPDPRNPNSAERLKAGAYNAVVGATNFPAIGAIIKQEMGLKNAQFTTPAAIRLINSALGGPNGFVEMYNTDRQYLIKKMTIDKHVKELESSLYSLYAKEKTSLRPNTSWMSGVPGTTAKEVFNEMQSVITGAKTTNNLVNAYTQAKKNPVSGQVYPSQDLAKVVGDLKGMLEENRKMDDNFVKTKERQIEVLKQKMKETGLSKDALLKQEAEDAFKPEPEATPEPEETSTPAPSVAPQADDDTDNDSDQ